MVTILKIKDLWHKTKWIHSIRTKLVLVYIMVNAIAFICFSGVIYNNIEDAFIKERVQELLRRANIAAVHIEKNRYLFNTNYTQFSQDLEQLNAESSARILVCDLNAKVINDSSKKDVNRIYAVKEIITALSGKEDTYIDKNNNIIGVAVPIRDEKSRVIGAVYFLNESRIIDSIKETLSQKLLFTSIFTIFITSMLIFIISKFITIPINNMLKVLNKVTDGKFDERIKVNGHDEFAELALAYNQMSARLQKVDANRQEFVSNVSHELKTPLSSMKVLLESLLIQDDVPKEMYKEFLTDTNAEIDRLNEIINHLLTLVKLDIKVVPMSIESININQMIEGIVKRMQPLIKNKEIKIEIQAEKDVIVEIDKIKMTLAISNLVENAIKYTDEGVIKVNIDSDHQNAYVSVEDTGIGIANEEQDKIFERFYRTDKTRDRGTGGTGLGLAITHRAVILHSGSIKVTSEIGKGSTFSVRIPLKQNK